MTGMRWSGRLWIAAFASAMNLAFAGCAARTWPSVGAVGDEQFMNRRRAVQRVDVLPVDMQLWTDRSVKSPPDALAQTFTNRTRAAISSTLANLGYDVGAHIEWDGRYTGGDGLPAHAMSESEVAATAYSLSSYGRALRGADAEAVPPYLPSELGAQTGSDATLYVGGWAYVGDDDKPGTGSKVAKGVLIGALIIVVIAVAVIGIKRGGGGAVGRAAGGAGRVVGKAATGAARVAGRAGGTMLRVMARSADNFAEGMARSADALGRTHTHIEIHAGRPDYYQEPASPKKGRSQTYLEMTLVDNASGRTLWHARQRFPASAARSGHVVEMVHRMMATFPAAP